MGRRILRCAVALLAVPAGAEDAPEERIHADYRKLVGLVDFRSVDRRMDLVRALGRHRSARATEILLAILRSARENDDKVLAILALAPDADVPTAREVARVCGASRDPVLEEILGQALASCTRRDVLDWIVADLLASPQPHLIRAAARALVTLKLPEAAAPLLAQHERFLKRQDIETAYELLRAIGATGGEGAEPTVLVAAASADVRLRTAAAEALTRMERSPEVLAGLRALLGDAEPVVRQAAAAGIGDGKIEALVPDVAPLLIDPRLRTRYLAHEALKSIAGQDLGRDPGAWIRWWKDRSAAPGAADETYTIARYYGSPIESDRLVFVLDVSGSMEWRNRIGIAREQMRKVLLALPEQTRFNIVAFSSRVGAWQEQEVPASKANIERAITWVEKSLATPDGDTHTWTALRKVFDRNPHFDTVCFLSDGIPSHGEYVSHEGIAAGVAGWNRFRRAVIHTYALTLDQGRADYAAEKRFMRALADSTRGTCHVITHPPRD
jgi:HEAT repeat protein